jgi:hypothetical protein
MENDFGEPLYSGPGKSGICVCGHGWEDHHLCMIMKAGVAESRKEAYAPCECCFYGSNEEGGMMPSEAGWVHHCGGYVDRGE